VQYVGQQDIITNNELLILKVRDINLFSRAKHIMGSKRSRPPQKTPRNAPLYVLPQTKNLFPALSKSEVHWYFYFPKRERERERERESKSKSESENKSENKSESEIESGKGKGEEKKKGTGKGTGKRKERESTKALAILFLNLLGQSEKSANYTVLCRKEP
jgi:hypothetical protein